MLPDATQARSAHKLITAAEEEVRLIARRVARSERDRIEELHQIGMEVVCERAPSHAGEPLERFMQLSYHRILGAMLNTLNAESSERRILRAIADSVAPVTVHLDEGDYFAAEEERTAHRRRGAAAVIAASFLALVAPQASPSPELELEEAQELERVRAALDQAAATLPQDDWAIVQEIFYEGSTLQAAGERRSMTASGVWRRLQGSLGVLHRRMLEGLRK